MVIAINGRASVGKDTTGKIIQKLIIKGNATYSDERSDAYISQLAPQGLEYKSGWSIKKFAGKLKTIASLLTGIPEERFEDQDFKNSYMPSCWNYIKQTFELNEEGNDGFTTASMTYREFLQKLGTEAIRNGLHSETWVNALFADYIPKKSKNEEEEYESRLPNWIITDLRFPNEFDAVKKRDGFTIRVSRGAPDYSTYGRPAVPLHPSETALDDHTFDYVLHNSGTIEDLVIEVQEMLKHFKLLP